MGLKYFSTLHCTIYQGGGGWGGEGRLLNIKRVFFLFSLQLMSETFLVLRRIGRDMIIGLHVKYLLVLPYINAT